MTLFTGLPPCSAYRDIGRCWPTSCVNTERSYVDLDGVRMTRGKICRIGILIRSH